mmetsp:Transcript_3631/g.10105  ORF Transcript_3631/g.10105 Transcript_3631/m.10105 type:complete len:144 (-) Transcript_3631:565-996(-)
MSTLRGNLQFAQMTCNIIQNYVRAQTTQPSYSNCVHASGIFSNIKLIAPLERALPSFLALRNKSSHAEAGIPAESIAPLTILPRAPAADSVRHKFSPSSMERADTSFTQLETKTSCTPDARSRSARKRNAKTKSFFEMQSSAS